MTTDTLAPSGKPAWATYMWVDNTHVYLEIPSSDITKPPFITKFALSEQGLSKALSLMKKTHIDHAPKGGYYKITVQAPIKKIDTGHAFSQDQRERAVELLRKLGLI